MNKQKLIRTITLLEDSFILFASIFASWIGIGLSLKGYFLYALIFFLIAILFLVLSKMNDIIKILKVKI